MTSDKTTRALLKGKSPKGFIFTLLSCLLFWSTSSFSAVTEINGNQLKFTYTSENFCDLHYKVNGGGQLNVAMTNIGGGNYEYVVNNLSNGDLVEYYYTYQQNGLAYDTAWDSHNYGGGSSSSGSSSSTSSSGSSSSGGQSPFNGVKNIPGTFEAEDYDNGGEGVAYHDTTPGTYGNIYRFDDVDVGQATGSYAVGWMAPGEWLEYTVNVATAGTYEVKALTTSDAGGGTFHIEVTGNTSVTSAAMTALHTGGWDSWADSSSTSVNLNAGEHVVRVVMVSGNFNINSLTFTATAGSPPSNLPEAYFGYTGVYPGYTLKYDDRFDNFNAAVWAKGDGAVGSESDCRFQPQGVQVVNGTLELVIRNEFVPASWSNDHQDWKGAYNYSCGELRTIPAKRIKYGRIETRLKAPNRAVASGYISSLFTYVHEGVPREWEEIDVELEGGRPDKFQANLIYGVDVPDWNATRFWGRWEHKIDIAPADQWRVYAIEWEPNVIRWYVDGVLVKILDQDWIDCNPCNGGADHVNHTPIPDNLTELMMNFWIPNDQIQDVFGGNKHLNQYPMTTQYDWVRIYQLDSQPLTNW